MIILSVKVKTKLRVKRLFDSGLRLCTEKEQKRRWKEAKLIQQLEKQKQAKEEELKQQQSQEDEEEKTKGIPGPLCKNELWMFSWFSHLNILQFLSGPFSL